MSFHKDPTLEGALSGIKKGSIAALLCFAAWQIALLGVFLPRLGPLCYRAALFCLGPNGSVGT